MSESPFVVRAGNTAIGTVALRQWDGGMAVAGGLFCPNPNYNAQEHATELDGISIPPAAKLSLCWDDGRRLHCEVVTLVDWSREVGEEGREIAAYGVVDSDFPEGS
ncbi:hypothetical protein AN936_04755 [Sphingopyxis macrogoltabida]|uniref:Uncharacterized protein n=1 Tax=Sphingopyxis macrogoltabida TaxID=33050 RepID=A0A0N9U9G2_SPHMC|nr:hypothetical protein AN936_04755 [Sphingopyxis macrogoltabida]